jgi:hypothetical protein
MNGQLVIGSGRELRTISDDAFLQPLDLLPERMAERLAFMSPGHHAVRDFVVCEIPREGRPLSPLKIAQKTGIDVPGVVAILADLEKHLFFLVRDAAGNVAWAFPVTATPTAHRVTFSTGETAFGA